MDKGIYYEFYEQTNTQSSGLKLSTELYKPKNSGGIVSSMG